jgi:drug/metabolite transporter (DMT)-like permease
MTDLDMFRAKTQAKLAYVLIGTLIVLVFGVMGLLLMPKVSINEAIINLMVQVITGVLALTGTAIGFFFALRHTPPSDAAANDAAPPLSKTGVNSP